MEEDLAKKISWQKAKSDNWFILVIGDKIWLEKEEWFNFPAKFRGSIEGSSQSF